MNRHWLLSVAVFVMLVSCSNNPTELHNEQGFEVSGVDDKYQTALQQQMSGLNSMKSEAGQARMKAKEQEIIQWLQGTWKWSGRIHVWGAQYEYVSCKIVVDGEYITFYGNNGINDQGSITNIDIEEKRISFGRRSSVEYGKVNGEYRLYYSKKDGELFERVSSSSNTYSHSNSNGDLGYSSTTFRTSAEVLSYTGGKFKDRSGNVISVRQEGIYANGGYPRGQLITNAVKVVRFDATSALLTTSSPYGGGGAMYIRVDASQGTITDGSGCVYYKQ